MKRELNRFKYFTSVDLGHTRHFYQDGLEFDQWGFSLKDFPTPDEERAEELIDIGKMRLDPDNYIFPKSQQPYKTIAAAVTAVRRKRLDEEYVEFINVSTGIVIKYDRKDHQSRQI